MHAHEHPTEAKSEASISAGATPIAKSLQPQEVERVPFGEKSRWSNAIANGEKVYSVELLPPAGVVMDAILEKIHGAS
jgi:hypothetical protein